MISPLWRNGQWFCSISSLPDARVVAVAKDVFERHHHIEGVHIHVDKHPWERIIVDGTRLNLFSRRIAYSSP